MSTAGPLSRLSLRVRLVAGFVAAMLVVLTAAGGFVYWRVKYALDRELNSELTDTSARLAASVDSQGRLQDESPLLTGERYQVLDAQGRVLTHSPTAPTQSLLNASDVRAALTEPIRRDRGDLLPENSQAARLYAVPLEHPAPGHAAILVVTASRDQRDEALRELLLQLTVAGLVTLLVTAVVGDRLAKASLRPVERYRRQAIEVTEGASGVRLDVPTGRDDEITRLGHSLNQMLEALEEALEHERRFVNDASHELRTPLTLIGTRVQLARRRSRTIAEHEAVLDEITVDIDRISRLADQLLDIGKQQSATASAEVSDLALVARTQVERHRTLASDDSPYAQAGTLQVLTSGPAPVALHHAHLERVVANLLDNAARHGRTPVTVSVDTTEGVARLQVTDQGPGMDAATLATAPDRFVRAAAARSRPGSGLGLALVKATVLSARGELRLCCGGQHEHFGESLPVPCEHGDEMVVTVLLPIAAPCEVDDT